ncbi:MAG: hypothetical protein GXP45_08535 [bacterium]|nr:hypothetical protein [bacterium]
MISGDILQMKLISSLNYSEEYHSSLEISGYTIDFSVTTKDPVDVEPDAVLFDLVE